MQLAIEVATLLLVPEIARSDPEKVRRQLEGNRFRD
jgi:hypothetical protein